MVTYYLTLCRIDNTSNFSRGIRCTAMFVLEEHGPDAFVGIGPRYPWGGLYGGQIVAQAWRATANTVAADAAVHSLRAYFIRRGDHTQPIRDEVDRGIRRQSRSHDLVSSPRRSR
jgi:acyl-CoA thioesterase